MSQDATRHLSMRGLKIKTTRQHYAPIRTAETQNTDNSKHWDDAEQPEPSLMAAGTRHGAATVGDRWFLSGLNMLLPYDPAITLLGIYSEELKSCVCTKTGTWMLMAASFIISQLGSNQDVLRQVTDKQWSIQTMEDDPGPTRNEPPSHEKTWKKHICSLLSEKSHSEKAT